MLIFEEKPFSDPSQEGTVMSSSKTIGSFRLYEERGCQVALLLVLDDLR